MKSADVLGILFWAASLGLGGWRWFVVRPPYVWLKPRLVGITLIAILVLGLAALSGFCMGGVVGCVGNTIAALLWGLFLFALWATQRYEQEQRRSTG